MRERRAILRVSATYSLEVEVGDAVHRGDKIQTVPDTEEAVVSSVSGTVESIQFDSGNHEFVIVIAPAR